MGEERKGHEMPVALDTTVATRSFNSTGPTNSLLLAWASRLVQRGCL